MTGCGAGSIGEAILNALLAAGAQVVVTSSSFSTKTTQFFRYDVASPIVCVKMREGLCMSGETRAYHCIRALRRYKYEKHGGQGSALTLLPFNMGSLQDVRALVDYIYDQMGIDLDYVIPFAAISEGGREIDNIDDRSELGT
jgi:3-oxoacyl-ACP reductase-like protein